MHVLLCNVCMTSYKARVQCGTLKVRVARDGIPGTGTPLVSMAEVADGTQEARHQGKSLRIPAYSQDYVSWTLYMLSGRTSQIC